MRQLGIYNVVYVFQYLFALSPEVNSFHLLEIQQVVVLILHYRGGLDPLPQFGFPVLKHRLAEGLHTLIEVFELHKLANKP